MLLVVGTVALDSLGMMAARLPAAETTGGVEVLHPDMPGGTAGNVAMAIARLGGRARIASAVGPDFAGSTYERSLQEAGVELELVRAAEPTSRAYVFVDPSAPAQVTYFYPGASRALGSIAGVTGAARAHFCAGEISAYPKLMERMEWVSFDPGQEVFHRDVREIVACIEHVDLLFLNVHELRRLTALAALDARALLARGVGAIIETRGGDGAVLHTADGATSIPPVAARVAVDPTGAGDAHRAGVLLALERGAPLEVAARFGAVLGSFAVEAVGAQTGLPTMEQALARYAESFGGRPF